MRVWAQGVRHAEESTANVVENGHQHVVAGGLHRVEGAPVRRLEEHVEVAIAGKELIEIDGEEVEEFDIKLQPHPRAKIEQEALDVGGVTEDQIMMYQTMEAGKLQLTRILNRHVDRYDKNDKFHLIGYNSAGFDDKFFRTFFELCGDNYFGSWFWAGSLDVMVLAAQALRKERHLMENFKLQTVGQINCRPYDSLILFVVEYGHDE